MKTRDEILKHLSAGAQTATGLGGKLGVSKQAVSRHLRALISEGIVMKEGVTKGARFRLARAGEEDPALTAWEKTLPLMGLEEDLVFTEIAAALGLRRRLSGQAFTACSYAFTEMLNNAIEHSRSAKSRVEFRFTAHDVSFEVRDFGVGIFNPIQRDLGLADEHAAVAELLKG
ncbi:MAG: ArsR family transcriptional regulator, partial [Planctomycetota bacterium]